MHRPIRLLACALAFALAVPASAADRPDPEAVVGMRLADGTGYPSLVRLAHQADSSRDGALLMVFEQHGLAGIPLWRSDDDGVGLAEPLAEHLLLLGVDGLCSHVGSPLGSLGQTQLSCLFDSGDAWILAVVPVRLVVVVRGAVGLILPL